VSDGIHPRREDDERHTPGGPGRRVTCCSGRTGASLSTVTFLRGLHTAIPTPAASLAASSSSIVLQIVSLGSRHITP
jgi:hypothetical protein